MQGSILVFESAHANGKQSKPRTHTKYVCCMILSTLPEIPPKTDATAKTVSALVRDQKSKLRDQRSAPPLTADVQCDRRRNPLSGFAGFSKRLQVSGVSFASGESDLFFGPKRPKIVLPD